MNIKPKHTILALVLGICPAGAVTLEVLKDTNKKLDFVVDWHNGIGFEPIPHDGPSFVSIGWDSYSWNFNTQTFIDFDLYVLSPVFHETEPFYNIVRASFYMIFDGPDFKEFYLPEQVLLEKNPYMKLAHDNQSARWTFHEKDFLPVGVPDGGSGLMAIAIIGLLCYHAAYYKLI